MIHYNDLLTMPITKGKEYIVELIAVGNAVKATAFDPISLREVVVMGAAGTPRKVLENLAVRKLQFVLKNGEKKSS